MVKPIKNVLDWEMLLNMFYQSLEDYFSFLWKIRSFLISKSQKPMNKMRWKICFGGEKLFWCVNDLWTKDNLFSLQKEKNGIFLKFWSHACPSLPLISCNIQSFNHIFPSRHIILSKIESISTKLHIMPTNCLSQHAKEVNHPLK